ncbi:hypothetical protein Tco_1076596 [Tanacetum coccineum]
MVPVVIDLEVVVVGRLNARLPKNHVGEKKDSKSTVKVNNAQFQKFIHSEVLKSSNYDSDSREVRKDFKQYTHMEVQSFKDLIIQHMDSIEQYSRVQVQEVKASDASSGDKDISGIVSDSGNDQSLENQSNTSGDEISKSMDECNDKSTSGDDTDTRTSYDTEPMVEVPYTTEYNVFVVETQHPEQPENMNDTYLMEKIDSNTTPDSSDMCNNEFKDDQNADNHESERVVLADLIANLKFNIDENKKI